MLNSSSMLALARCSRQTINTARTMATASIVRLGDGNWPAYHRNGISSTATSQASQLLQKNHEEHHIFINSDGYHNHMAHLLLTLWALKASPDQLQQAYERNTSYQRPRDLTDLDTNIVDAMQETERFVSCLGIEKYYHAFLDFFSQAIDKTGWAAVLEKYVFAKDARANSMLSRLFAGFLHPIIHVGFGIEFGQPAIIAEGLAQAAIHDDWIDALLLTSEKRAASQTTSISIKQIYEDVRNDEQLYNAPHHKDPNKIRDGLLARAGDQTIARLATVHVDPEDLDRRTAEMTNVIAYCTAGAQKKDRVIKFDFFLLHSLNSSIFFSAIAASPEISIENKVRMLEWKIRSDVIMYASRKSPEIRIEEIRNYQPKQPSGWDQIHDRVLKLPEDGHACKLIRAIAHGEEICRPYEQDGSFPLKGSDWLQVGHMAIDSIEAEDEGPEPYVRGAGFNEAWMKFAKRAHL